MSSRVLQEFLLLFVASLAFGLSRAEGRAAQEAAPPESVLVNFPEAGELKLFVDYVGKVLDVRFVYGEELKGQQVELRPSPVELPRERLLEMLAGLLRVHDLAMVEVSPQVYRIVRSENASRSVSSLLPMEGVADPDSLKMVTQVLRVPSGKVDTLVEKIGKFTSSPKSEVLAVPERGLLIVTDYEARIAVLQSLISTLESAQPDVRVATVEVELGETGTEAVATQVSALLSEVYKKTGATQTPPVLRADVTPGAIVVIGSQRQIEEASELIERFKPTVSRRKLRTYTLEYLSTERAQTLLQKRLAGSLSLKPEAVRIDADAPTNRLFVLADESAQAAIRLVLDTEDRPLPTALRPLRIYRPQNRKAAELLATLTQVLGQAPEKIAEEINLPSEKPSSAPSRPSSVTPPAAATPSAPPKEPTAELPPVPPEVEAALKHQPTAAKVEGPDYLLVEDEATNAILALGTPEFHAQLKSLIDELDRRRPQVLIEMTLVAVTLSDSLDLGVELEAHDLKGAWDYLVFTSFGLSQIDVTTGQRMLLPGLGGSGVLISPENIPILLRTLATHGLARVVSTPKILVSDNAKGLLRNVDEAPFTSVNASDTVATTSFAGFESAGTTLSVTPHIQEGDLITLEYELSFSNFTGSANAAGVPPPRTTNSFSSTIEVPDGYAVVTGGLEVRNESDTVSELPLVGRIPILGVLFQSSSKKKNSTRIFAFLRPVILRDDEFAALKFISLKDLERAEVLENKAPASKPLWMR